LQQLEGNSIIHRKILGARADSWLNNQFAEWVPAEMSPLSVALPFTEARKAIVPGGMAHAIRSEEGQAALYYLNVC
jgi:hypothetical protein